MSRLLIYLNLLNFYVIYLLLIIENELWNKNWKKKKHEMEYIKSKGWNWKKSKAKNETCKFGGMLIEFSPVLKITSWINVLSGPVFLLVRSSSFFPNSTDDDFDDRWRHQLIKCCLLTLGTVFWCTTVKTSYNRTLAKERANKYKFHCRYENNNYLIKFGLVHDCHISLQNYHNWLPHFQTLPKYQIIIA